MKMNYVSIQVELTGSRYFKLTSECWDCSEDDPRSSAYLGMRAIPAWRWDSARVRVTLETEAVILGILIEIVCDD